MKTIFLFLALCIANFSFAQDQEERNDTFIAENNKNILKIDIKILFIITAIFSAVFTFWLLRKLPPMLHNAQDTLED